MQNQFKYQSKTNAIPIQLPMQDQCKTNARPMQDRGIYQCNTDATTDARPMQDPCKNDARRMQVTTKYAGNNQSKTNTSTVPTTKQSLAKASPKTPHGRTIHRSTCREGPT